ncbi:hypothetical protein [Methanosarcina sp.]|uniref:hypothetical protein n=1 Tax=Methanosarcina sp. TaxID=2213 RepID=UPI002ABAC81A|nr:hypothetical protein [Methanosarcina sp.]MDY9926215.1 hypothetical protein [Methanosarcina sp.]
MITNDCIFLKLILKNIFGNTNLRDYYKVFEIIVLKKITVLFYCPIFWNDRQEDDRQEGRNSLSMT